jgi:hypothetical protein
MKRTIGPVNDPRFAISAKACGSDNRENFMFGACSVLIYRVLNGLNNEALKASLSTGTSIAALVPTILAMVDKSCAQGIAAPTGLCSIQLGLLQHHYSFN